jgi:hypothetical protein
MKQELLVVESEGELIFIIEALSGNVDSNKVILIENANEDIEMFLVADSTRINLGVIPDDVAEDVFGKVVPMIFMDTDSNEIKDVQVMEVMGE